MQKRSSKRKPDLNEGAFNVLQAVLGAQTGNPPVLTEEKKNPAAVALGRLGGLKGGKARAAKLSARKRKEIAAKAAAARWKKKPKA